MTQAGYKSKVNTDKNKAIFENQEAKPQYMTLKIIYNKYNWTVKSTCVISMPALSIAFQILTKLEALVKFK